MSNDRNLTPSSLLAPHMRAFDDCFSLRMDTFKLDRILVYLIDTVDVSILPYLANQFDVSGYKGYVLATTDAQRRDIIKKAIQLKRYMGTLYAIKLALKSAGFGDEATIYEGVGTVGDGKDWARFSVVVTDGGLTVPLTAEATRLILLYKNVRSEFLGVFYPVDESDPFDFLTLDETGDELLLDADTGDVPETEDLITPLYLDGSWLLDGSYNYGEAKGDTVTITVIP